MEKYLRRLSNVLGKYGFEEERKGTILCVKVEV
jgi:hypothetical protein